MTYIKRFIYQRCIGYSADFSRGYWEGRAEMDDGTERNVYAIGDEWRVGTCPRPPIPNEPPEEPCPQTTQN